MSSAVTLPPADAPVRPSFVGRLVAVPGRLLGALFFPDRTLPGEVASGRFGAALIAVVLCAGLAAVAIGPRLDLSASVGRGPDAPKTDREVADAVAKARVVAQVKLGMKAGLGTPLHVTLLAVGLYLLGRYVGGKPTFGRALSAASHGSLPMAAKSLISAGAALRTAHLDPEAVSSLAMLPMGRTRFLAAIDPFTVWSVVLLGFGLAQAAGITRKKAFIAIIVGTAAVLAGARIVSGGGPPPGGVR